MPLLVDARAVRVAAEWLSTWAGFSRRVARWSGPRRRRGGPCGGAYMAGAGVADATWGRLRRPPLRLVMAEGMGDLER
ncbi:hypothetical protein GCM10010403_20200 [Glycomyces rutgersensis]|uniref:Uncharacterized protein n=1 Tax=Glycomyces rutgersensis TaxID=58115 RepID=A0ABN3FFR9_9ACTN